MRLIRTLLAIATGSSFLLAACQSAGGSVNGSPTPTAAQSTSRSDPLVGSWSVRLSLAEIRAGFVAGGGPLNSAGYRQIVQGLPATGMLVTLKFGGGAIAVIEARPAGLDVGYTGSYKISRDIVRFFDDGSACIDVYRFQVRGRQLQLHLVSASGCGWGKIDPPGRALFANLPFTKDG